VVGVVDSTGVLACSAVAAAVSVVSRLPAAAVVDDPVDTCERVSWVRRRHPGA